MSVGTWAGKAAKSECVVPWNSVDRLDVIGADVGRRYGLSH